MNTALLVIVAFIIFGGILVGGQALRNNSTTLSPTASASGLPTNPVSSDRNLQLGAFTPSPIATTLPVAPAQAAANTPTSPTLTSSTSCIGKKVAVDLLIDTSGSMSCRNSLGDCKIDSLKTAVLNFIQKLRSDDVIAAQVFGTGTGSIQGLDRVSNVRNSLRDRINRLSVIDDRGTPMVRGLNSAEYDINAAKSTFADYYFVLILLSDGAPNPGDNPVPIAQRIRQSGTKIVSIGLQLADQDKASETQARAYLTQIADPGNFYEPNASQLLNIYNQISSSICR